MALWPFVEATLMFRRLPTTILVVAVYAILFVGVLISDPVAQIPKDTLGLDLDEAYSDLHQIARQPHPLNSHANELVRAYVLGRVQNITSGFSHIQVVDDQTSNASWTAASHGVSFEGSNILVKVEGTEPAFSDKGGVLFSAHFDSVSTAPGVTDDGIGIATLIQFIKYLTTHRTRRTAVFNINNGEEDGLNGAHVFFQHTWSTIPDTFLNLEGAAAGGRPLLFRATSTAPVRSFKNNLVPRPHGNVLSADAFARGVVASGTDFSVYNLGLGDGTGMEGIDLAFYQGRSKYHTKYDSLPGANGGKESLWAMMETVRGSGLALLNDDDTHAASGEAEAPVYFDLFGRSFVVFTQRSLFKFNIAILILCPLILLVLYRLPDITARLADSKASPNTPPPNRAAQARRVLSEVFAQRSNANSSFWTRLKELRWTKPSWWKEQWSRIKTGSPGRAARSWRWSKFWVTFILGLVLEIILVVTILSANPIIVHSQPYIVLSSMLTLAYLTITFVLHAPFHPGGPSFSDQQRWTMLLQTYILSWILLVIATIFLKRLQIGGTYFLVGWNVFVFLGCVSALFERVLHRSNDRVGRPKTPLGEEEDEGHRLGTPSKMGSVADVDADRAGPSSSISNLPRLLNDAQTAAARPKPTERTPLMLFSRRPTFGAGKGSGIVGWWILQLLIVIPIPVILFSHILILFIAALNQTLSDGSSPVIVYGAMAILSFLIVLPMAPFSFKIHRSVTSMLLVVFIVTTIYNWAAFPFSQEAPMKVFFQQRITVNLADPTQPPQALTTITGLTQYVASRVIPPLPSSWGSTVECASAATSKRLSTCGWRTSLIPSPSGNTTAGSTQTWITSTASRLSPTSALISVRGTNTRSCRIYFDTPISGFNVYEVSSNGTTKPSRSAQPSQPAYPIPPSGLSALWMWSRTWDREFTVEVTWPPRADGSAETFSGQVGCEWAEYDSATLGLGLERNVTGSIPAFEEVLGYLPKWAAVTKLGEGLVEVLGGFSV